MNQRASRAELAQEFYSFFQESALLSLSEPFPFRMQSTCVRWYQAGDASRRGYASFVHPTSCAILGCMYQA